MTRRCSIYGRRPRRHSDRTAGSRPDQTSLEEKRNKRTRRTEWSDQTEGRPARLEGGRARRICFNAAECEEYGWRLVSRAVEPILLPREGPVKRIPDICSYWSSCIHLRSIGDHKPAGDHRRPCPHPNWMFDQEDEPPKGCFRRAMRQWARFIRCAARIARMHLKMLRRARLRHHAAPRSLSRACSGRCL